MSSLRMLDCYRNVGLTFKMFGTMFTDWNMTAAMKGLLQLGLTAADYAVVAVAVVLVLCVSLKQRRGSTGSGFMKEQRQCSILSFCAFICL